MTAAQATAGPGADLAAAADARAGDTDLSARRLARAALSYLAEPGDPALGTLLQTCAPDDVLAAIRAGQLPAVCRETDRARWAALTRALGRWRLRLPDLPAQDVLSAYARGDGQIRLCCPGDPDWPAALDDLGWPHPACCGCAAPRTSPQRPAGQCPWSARGPRPDTASTWPANSPATWPCAVGGFLGIRLRDWCCLVSLAG